MSLLGLMFGTVTANHNEDFPGMVQVKLPLFLSEGSETFWAQVITPYAGKGYGSYFLPEVGDMVLVGFLGEDISTPLVLGSCWMHQKNTLPERAVEKENKHKLLQTKGGHTIELADGDEGGLTVTTKGGHRVTIRDKEQTITLSTKDGKQTVELNEKEHSIRLEAAEKLSIKAKKISLEGEIEAKGPKITLKADNGLTLKAQQLQGEGSTTKLKGQSLEVSGTNVTVKSSSLLTLKGSMTKIN